MIEIRTEFGRFNVTNRRLAHQDRTVTKNYWSSDLEIREIHEKTFRQTHQNPHLRNRENKYWKARDS